MSFSTTQFGRTRDGEPASLYIFENSSGMKMKVSSYGAALVSVIVKDRQGIERDVAAGYDDALGYEEDDGIFFGAIVGRNANRIGKASAVIDGKEYKFAKNDHGNNLHSGPDYFMKRHWKVEAVGEDKITFALFSPHMDQGYPGNVKIFVTYTLTDDNEIQIEYKAEPDADTILNMTNHSYFNLDGYDGGSILEQKVWIDADAYTAADSESIPTGEIVKVEGTPMDFRTPKAIGQDISSDYQAIRYGGGYDHNYVLNGEGYRRVASMESEKTGIRMSVYTDLPGIQLYTGNFLKGQAGKGGFAHQKRSAACFETQFFPDAVNHGNFESPVCKKGDTYYTKTGYRFEVN